MPGSDRVSRPNDVRWLAIALLAAGWPTAHEGHTPLLSDGASADVAEGLVILSDLHLRRPSRTKF